MTTTLTTTMRPATPRFVRTALGLIAAASFISAGPSAFAGKAELTILEAQLGKPVGTATSDELAAAVVAIAQANTSKKNPGVIAGEALRGAGSAALDAGEKISAAVLAAFPTTIPFGTKTLSKNDFAAAAIKTTGSGKPITLVQVPDFAAGFFTEATVNETKPLAILVKGTKGAAGAVIQGGASLITTDANKAIFARDAVADKAFSSVIQDVTKGVAVTVTDIVGFTDALVSAPANAKNLLKIIPGIAAGQPTAAGAIVTEAFENPLYAPQGSKSPIVKGASTLAKTIGALADIEQIQKVGEAIAKQIPITTLQGTKQVPNIKLSQATGIASTLAKAIAAKPFAATGANRTDNKADELGELAAYMISAMSTSAEFTATKVVKGVTVAANADKIVTGLLKAIVTGGKAIKTGAGGTAPTKADVAAYLTKLASYVSGSVALTVSNLPAGPIKDSIIAALNKTGFAKGVAGATNEAAVIAAITDGLAGGVGGRFENGFDVATGALTDPETNIRNF